jgi:hypothetical protein
MLKKQVPQQRDRVIIDQQGNRSKDVSTVEDGKGRNESVNCIHEEQWKN